MPFHISTCTCLGIECTIYIVDSYDEASTFKNNYEGASKIIMVLTILAPNIYVCTVKIYFHDLCEFGWILENKISYIVFLKNKKTKKLLMEEIHLDVAYDAKKFLKY